MLWRVTNRILIGLPRRVDEMLLIKCLAFLVEIVS